jgi:hypothetical protein
MMCSPMNGSDLDEIRAIHEKYFSSEFAFPDFYKFFCALVIRSDSGEVITAGGVRNIAELVLITNKSFPARIRRDALLRALEVARVTSRKEGNDQLHTFIQDQKWFRQLEKRGFSTCNGKYLVTGV